MKKFCAVLFLFFSLCLISNSYATNLQLQHAAGGQSTTLVIGDKFWYQAIGEKVLVLSKNGGAVISSIDLASPASALCTDLIIRGKTLYALLDEEEVIELSIDSSGALSVKKRIGKDDLGILPKSFGTVGKSPVVFGEGGVVRLSDGVNILDFDGLVNGVAYSLEFGTVYVSDRKIYDGESGRLLGLASNLYELDKTTNAIAGTLIYARTLGEETEVGLFTSELVSVNKSLSKELLEGDLESVLVRGSRAYVVTSSGIFVLGISPKELRLLRAFSLDGINKIGVLASNYFAVCGNFGRGLFRIDEDRGGNSETLFRVVPSNGPMQAGSFDSRGLSIPLASGSAYYVDSEFKLKEGTVKKGVVSTSAVVLGGEVIILGSGREVSLLTSRGETRIDIGSPATTVVANEGDFWFGTDDGVSVYGLSDENTLLKKSSIKLAGPVLQLIPMLDGRVLFVSGAGFVGIIEETQEAIAFEQ
jgi:hypothetical protein